MLRATKVRIYPTPEQAKYLNGQFGAVRFAYNKALHIKKHTYKRHGVSLNPHKDLKPAPDGREEITQVRLAQGI